MEKMSDPLVNCENYVDKVLTKFTSYTENYGTLLDNQIRQIQKLEKELLQGEFSFFNK